MLRECFKCHGCKAQFDSASGSKVNHVELMVRHIDWLGILHFLPLTHQTSLSVATDLTAVSNFWSYLFHLFHHLRPASEQKRNNLPVASYLLSADVASKRK